VGDIPARHSSEDRPRRGGGPAFAAVAEVAARQHGVVTRRQLRAVGVGDGSVSWWVRTGRLHRLHHGVYALGHPVVTPEGRWLAAVLACGPGAALSHRSAAALWGIGVADRGRVDVTVPRTRSGPAGIAVHRGRRLDADETTTLRAIAVTTLPRTLADLADVLAEPRLARAIHEAEVARSLAPRALEAAARRTHGRRGNGRLCRALAEPDRTRSELERRFRRLCRDHGLPPPAVNATVARMEVDFLWPDARVVAETDGWAFHRTRTAFEHDRERDQALARAGHRVLRFTHRQVVERPAEVVATLRAALG
jgi:very-short-patch-repair endonuclease